MTRYLDQCSYGKRSLDVLSTCSANIQRLMREAIRRAPRRLDFSLICGHRGRAAQEQAFLDGASKKRWPDSEHNIYPSPAIDILPWPFEERDWKDAVRFGRVVGFIEGVAEDLIIPIRCGLDWDGDGRSIDESLKDLGHLEEARAQR